ncbi:MAG: C69 family dipeptidase, partial [Bacteroidales bacterium]|nr:C69 family dipeptidase [Bacteroidales bacterium]
PEGAKGILWFGVDDTYTTVNVPMYCSIEKVPHCFAEGNGSMV